ncbi:MAG: hypothetical protein M3R24_34230, partial [Chloroflexota bacterium]|nr:hypothetical protein [Chloroflexota bacterium]
MEGELRDFLHGRLAKMSQEVQAEDKNRLLNVNETEYIAYLVQKYQVGPLVVDWDNVSASDREELIPAERFPQDFHVYDGKRYPKQIIRYHIPYSGSHDLLRYTPSTRLMWSPEVQLIGNEVCFDIINWRDDLEQIRREAESLIGNMRRQFEYVNNDVQQYNRELESSVRGVVQARKTQHLKQSNLMASLGVPFKKVEQVPSTFTVPITKKPLLVKPAAPSAAFTPEPTLDDGVYNDILTVCHDLGVEMERHPSWYAGKDEQTLRDHFLLMLSPHFQSVSGETFNKTGKTDVLIRHERSNVFVAECKFWGGAKLFHQTIDQILGYLTWRDSKAAVLLFIQNKELNPV